MPLSPEDMDAAVLRNLADKTGKTLAHWLDLLNAAGPFDKPAAAVAWLKQNEGLGYVTAQILVRTWNGATPRSAGADPIAEVLGAAGAAALAQIIAGLAPVLPDVRLMPRKAYVGLGRPVQFAVAARPKRSGAILWLALVRQDEGLARLPPAPRLGGSDRFGVLLEVEAATSPEVVQAHLRAAAGCRAER